MAAFDDAAERGLENLTDALSRSAQGWLKLFGFKRGPDGWSRTDVWGKEQRDRAANDRMQWIPKFNATMPTVQKPNGWVDPFKKPDSFRVENGQAYFFIREGGKVSKVRYTANGGIETIWTRWEA